MPEYIDKTKLVADGWVMSRIYKQDSHTMMYESKKIADIPSEDVEPIIRCKHCSYWNDWDSTGKVSLGNYRCSCAYWTSEDGPTWYTAPTDFCSYGERKEVDNDVR